MKSNIKLAKKNQEWYDDQLNNMPFEALKNWCLRGLTVAQRKEIFRASRDTKHFKKMKPCYLYTIDGVYIETFESREDAGEQIEILRGGIKSSVGYISGCLRSKRPVYGMFWVTESFPFNPKIYNNDNILTGKNNKK